MKRSPFVLQATVGALPCLPSCSNFEIDAAASELSNCVPERVISEPFGDAEVGSADAIIAAALTSSHFNAFVPAGLSKLGRNAEPAVAAKAAG